MYVRVERARQAAWREAWPDLPEPARSIGSFDGRRFAWLLAADHAAQTLWSPIRAPLIEHFRDRDIVWHDEDEERYGARLVGPSPNLMDSQVACLHFWWGLAAVSPDALLAVTRTFAPDAVRMVAPAANLAFHEGVTAPALRGRGRIVAAAWRTVLKDPSRYTSLAYEDLFAILADRSDTASWASMCRARYGWAS